MSTGDTGSSMTGGSLGQEGRPALPDSINSSFSEMFKRKPFLP